MKTRLSNTRLKEKELNETTLRKSNHCKSNNLRRFNPKSKTNQGTNNKASNVKHKNKITSALLPDQQIKMDLLCNCRPVCVKIKRLKPEKMNKNDKIEMTSGIMTPNQDLNCNTISCNRKNTVYNVLHSIPPKTQKFIVDGQKIKDALTNDKGLNVHLNKKILPCCVKIKRLPLAMLKEKVDLSKDSNVTSQECNPSKEETLTTVSGEVLNVSSEREINELTNKDKESVSQDKANKRFSFRNPILALTKRRFNEMRVQNANGDINKGNCKEFGNVLKHDIKPNEKNRNIRNVVVPNLEVESKSLDQKTEELKDMPRTSPQNLFNKPGIITELLLADNGANEKSAAQITQYKNKQPLKKRTISLKKTDQVKKNLKRYRIKTKSLCCRTSGNENDVYEFLSQSQNSDSDAEKRKDPAADIIKHMIEQGKVAVTRNLKGKPVLVNQRRNIKPARKKYQTLQENKKALKKRSQIKPVDAIIPEVDEDTHTDENFENVGVLPAIPTNNGVIIPSNEATFSNLARSVLIQQTNHKNSVGKTLADKKRVLEITCRESSTPIKRPRLSLQTDVADLSAIPKLNDKEKTLEDILEDTIDFEQNTSYNNLFHNTVVSNAPQNGFNITSLQRRTSLVPADHESRQQSPLSSFSSNDSNAENLPPSPNKDRSVIRDENSFIFNNRQTPNPRQTLPKRSVLQPINIIDVVLLPPYRRPVASDKDKTDHKKNEEIQPLFGFEEYLDEDQNELQDSNHNNSSSLSLTNLRRRLKRLKKWRPSVSHYKDTKSSTITKNIFDDKLTKERQHYDIRNMLCSTMVSTPSKEPNNTSRKTAIDSSDEGSDNDSTRISKENNAVDLFGDPETTFSKENLHRTYERPSKNKRKVHHEHKHQQKSKEVEHEIENDNEELEKFVLEFNSLIKEAEEYELIVE